MNQMTVGTQDVKKKRRANPWRGWRRPRKIMQVAVFVLFVYLLVDNWRTGLTGELTNLFFRFNPLAAITSMVAARAWIPAMGLALTTVGMTIVLGRVWCGWLCPLGSLLDWVRPSGKGMGGGRPKWRTVKYVILFVTLAMAAFGSLWLLVLDPITLLTRAMVTSVLPGINYAITSAEISLYGMSFMRPVINWVESSLRGAVLPSAQPVFTMGLVLFLLLGGVVALNWVANRFWCRYICPLGGLLGLLSKVSILKPVIGESCNRCGRCERVCQMDAIEVPSDEASHQTIIPSECVLCLDCFADCPQQSIDLVVQPMPSGAPKFDPGRREALEALAATAAVGAAGVSLLRVNQRSQNPDPFLIRPPGVKVEEDFISQCIRCSACMQVCPTSALQPALFQGGPEGLWTPYLVPRTGYCDFSCNACGQVCPTGAIPPLDLETKRQEVIGLAVIDRSRCLPWAYNTPCIVCEEMCPIPDKAIRLEEVIEVNEHSEEVFLQQPYVLRDLCIGCGICEYHCPMEARSAIRVQRRQGIDLPIF